MHIIVDSCCDLPEEVFERIKPTVVTVTVNVKSGDSYGPGADIPAMLKEIAAKGASSASPSVQDFVDAMTSHDGIFVVTLSDQLSGTYNAARLAADIVREQHPDKKICVVNSESASTGEAVIAMYIQDKIDQGLKFEQIVPLVKLKVAKMKTMFVLEDLGILIKTGRVKKLPGMLASVLSLCPIMSDDGHGSIKLLDKARGIQNSLRRMVEIVEEQTAEFKEKLPMVLGFCECRERAETVKEQILAKCPWIEKVLLVPTGAVSSLYANKGGIVVAY